MVIGCTQVPERRHRDFEVCQLHHDDEELARILAEGSWPGEFWSEGKKMLLPTRRRLDGTREEGQGLYKEKPHG